jgi:hypothetical protein
VSNTLAEKIGEGSLRRAQSVLSPTPRLLSSDLSERRAGAKWSVVCTSDTNTVSVARAKSARL